VSIAIGSISRERATAVEASVIELKARDASHFVPEDALERLVAWIETFLAAHPCRVAAIWACAVAREGVQQTARKGL